MAEPVQAAITFPGGSTSVQQVTTLPGSCTPGTQVSLTVNGAALGLFICTANNVFIPENPSQTISPYAYGAVGHVRYTYNAAWTNTSTTVTCANGECNFQCPGGVYPCTSTTPGCPSVTCDAGKIVKGSAMFPQVNTSALTAAGIGNTLPQGTISTVTNSTTITVSNAATNTCPTGALTTCTLSWGIQDDTTALNNAVNAAWSNGNRCLALQLPSDNFYITGPVFNIPPGQKAGDPCSTLNAANGGSDLTNSGPTLMGTGAGTTTLIPLSMNYAACTFGSGISCMGTMPNLQAHDFAVNGLGDIGSGTHSNVLWESIGSNAGGACDGGTTVWNLSLSNFGLNVQGLVGFQFGAQSCAAAQNTNNAVVMFGSTPCSFIGTQVYSVITLYCAGGGAGLGNVFNINQNGGLLNTFGSQFVCLLNAGNQVVAPQGGGAATKWNSNGDMFRQGDAQCAVQGTVLFTGKMLADFTDSQAILGTNAAAGSFLYLNNSQSGVVHFRNTILNANGDAGSTAFSTGATDKVFFDGGNKITNAGNANSFSGPVFGATNDANGTLCATGNFALTSGWGTSSVTSVAANGNILGCHVTVTGAAGSAGPTLTWTYPAAPIVAPSSCHISGGAFGTLTGAQSGTPGATSVLFTFTGTPSAQTYNFDVGCP